MGVGVSCSVGSCPCFFEKSFLVESASSDGKKAPDDLAFYKNYINLPKMIPEMNR